MPARPTRRRSCWPPTGLAFDATTDTLYVASTGDNAIYAVGNAAFTHTDGGKGTSAFNDPRHLNGPLGLALAPNGDLLTPNGDAFNPNSKVPPGALIEFAPAGQFVHQLLLDPVAGAAFGLALTFDDGRLTLATVNEDTNSLDLRTITQHCTLPLSCRAALPPHCGRGKAATPLRSSAPAD